MIKRLFFLLIGFSTVALADTGTQPVNIVTVHGSTVSVASDGGILTHTTNGGSGGTSATYGAAFPSLGTPNGGVGPNSQFQAFRANASSDAYVYVVNTTSITTASPITVITSSNGVNASTMAVVMLNSLSVTLSSSGVNASTVAAVILGNVSVNQHGVTVANWVSTASVSVNNWVSSVSVSNWVSTASVSVNNWVSSVSVSNWVSTANVVVSNWVSTGTTVIFSSAGATASTAAVVILGSPNVAVNNWVSTVTASQANSYTVTQGTPTYWVISQSTFTGTLADNGVAAATNRIGNLNGIAQTSYRNGTAATQGRDSAASYGTDGLLWTANLPALRPADYHASSATQVAATATDIAEVCGNATNTTLVTAIRVSCTQTTAGIVHLSILKRSTANSNVTAGISTMTVIASDSNYAANSTTATYVYTSNPTRGTLLGQLDAYNIGCMAAGTATPNDIYLSPAWWRTKPIVLRNTRECVTVSLANGVDGNGTTVTGGVFNLNFDWIETATITP